MAISADITLTCKKCGTDFTYNHVNTTVENFNKMKPADVREQLDALENGTYKSPLDMPCPTCNEKVRIPSTITASDKKLIKEKVIEMIGSSTNDRIMISDDKESFTYTDIEKNKVTVEAYYIMCGKPFVDTTGSTIKYGTKGGHVTSLDNISQNGKCWIAEGAAVLDGAKVEHDAVIKDKAIVYGNARISQNAKILGECIVAGNATISGKVIVEEHAKVYEDANMHQQSVCTGYGKIYGCADVSGNSEISGAAEVYGNAIIGQHAKIGLYAKICDNVYVGGTTEIKDGTFTGDDLYTKGAYFRYIPSENEDGSSDTPIPEPTPTDPVNP